MKIYIKSFIYSLLTVFFILFFFEYFLFVHDVRDIEYGDFGVTKSHDRLIQNLPYDKTKPDIVTLGCSFVYGGGQNVKQDDTFAYKLQKTVNRRVYNRGYNATGPQHVLYQLENAPFYNSSEINPDLFIYVFITDHMRRMYTNYFDDIIHPEKGTGHLKYLKYTIKNNRLVLLPTNEPYKDWFRNMRIFRRFNTKNILMKPDNKKFDLLKVHLKFSQSVIKNKFPGARFVVIVYNPNTDLHGFRPFYTNRWKELEEYGITVIDFSGHEYDYLNTPEYLDSDGVHPNGKAWESLIPVIKEKLNL